MIEDDYGMISGELSKKLRAPLIGYFLQLMKIGPGDESQLAQEQQIILINKDQVSPYIF